MNKSFVILSLYFILYTAYSIHPATVRADWLIDRSGSLVRLDPLILGDSDEQESEQVKVEEKSKESKPTEVKPAESESRSVEQKSLEKARERAQKNLEQTVRNNEINAIRNKLEKESEIEVDGNKLKLKQKIKDASGRETETKLQLENGEELQVESKDGDETKQFKLRARQDDSLEVEQNGVRVSTKLPISLNKNNELVVTRPDGTTKILAVMPDQALKMLREQNITPDETIKDASGDSTGLPELEEEDGQSVYKIDGAKQAKILGLFKTTYKTKAVVSAETGEIIRTELSGFDRFLSLFSF